MTETEFRNYAKL